jgi:hypothetical protein
MTRRQLLAICCALAVSVVGATVGYAASRASLTGTWIVTIETPQGAMENTWELDQTDDGDLSGMTSNDMMGDNPFEGGWVDSDTFGFDMYIDFQGQGIDISYEGTFTEDEMSGILNAGGGEFTADFTGVRADGGAR